MTLTDFLLARIAEDEADIARIGYDRHVAEMGGQFSVDHPLRLLAERKAKRRIVEDHRWCEWGCEDEPMCRDCITLAHLAAVYADHPDYREEWTP